MNINKRTHKYRKTISQSDYFPHYIPYGCQGNWLPHIQMNAPKMPQYAFPISGTGVRVFRHYFESLLYVPFSGYSISFSFILCVSFSRFSVSRPGGQEGWATPFPILGGSFWSFGYFQNVLIEFWALTRFAISGVRVGFDVCLFSKRVE